MKKVATALTIAATAILLLSGIALLLCIVFQQPLIQFLYDYSALELDFNYADSLVTLLAMIPVARVISLIITLGCGALLCFTVCNQKLGWWTEVVAIGALVGAPVLNWGIQLLQWWFIGRSEYPFMIHYSHLSNLASYSTAFVGFATSLLLVACGMSIAYKHLNRSALKDAAHEEIPASEN